MIDYNSFTGTITVVETGVGSKKPDETPNLITSKGAKALLKVTDGKWDYWRRMNLLPEPYRNAGKKFYYRIVDIEKLKELL